MSQTTSESAGAAAPRLMDVPRSFDDWQRSFVCDRLRILSTLGGFGVASYMMFDVQEFGWFSTAVAYRSFALAILVLLLVLVQTRRRWVERYVDSAVTVVGCCVTIPSLATVPLPADSSFQEAVLAFNGARFAITLIFFAIAVMAPARLRAHLVLQLATLAFFALHQFEVYEVLSDAGGLLSRMMGLIWVCGSANISIALFTRLQHREFEARAQLEREGAERKQYLDGLVRVGASATASDPDLQAGAVLNELVKLLGADRAQLYLAAEDGTLVFRAGRDAAGRNTSGELAATPGSVRVPLRVQDALVGEIVLERSAEAGVMSTADEDFLQTLASHAAIALETLRTAGELRVAHDKALDASRTKDAFLQTMSHELRTPITTMLGYTEMLAEDLEESGDSEHAADAQAAHDAAAGLLATVSDVLELTQLEAEHSAESLSSFAVTDLLAEIEAETRPLAERNANHLDVRVDASVGSITSDRERLGSVLRKLLDNACKFTERGKVTLDVIPETKNGKQWLHFRVSDTGIGMTEEQLARCFEAFYQADPSATRAYGGSGLGLAAAERLTEKLHGTITASANSDTGASFLLALPVDSEQ